MPSALLNLVRACNRASACAYPPVPIPPTASAAPMPIYHVKPVPSLLDDPAWQSSNTRTECWVNAADAAEARGMVSGRYENAEVNMPGHARGPSPWRDERLVDVRVVDAPPNGATLPNGVVMDSQQN